MDWTLCWTILGANFGIGLAVVGVNVALMSWIRSDMAMLQLDMKSFENKVESWKDELHKETKDFHGRLVAIEERNKAK